MEGGTEMNEIIDICKDCVRNMVNTRMTDCYKDGYISPYEQKMIAAKCSNCKHDKKEEQKCM